MNDNNPPESPLSGQQLSAMQRQFQDALRNAIKDTELRKLALEKAVAIVSLGAKPVAIVDLMAMSESIHAFLSAPAAEIKITTG